MISGSGSGDELQELMETENPDDLTMTTAEYGNDTSMFEASPPATKEVFRKRQNDPVARRLPIRDDLFSKCGARRAPWGFARAHVPLSTAATEGWPFHWAITTTAWLAGAVARNKKKKTLTRIHPPELDHAPHTPSSFTCTDVSM